MIELALHPAVRNTGENGVDDGFVQLTGTGPRQGDLYRLRLNSLCRARSGPPRLTLSGTLGTAKLHDMGHFGRDVGEKLARGGAQHIAWIVH